MNVKFVLEGMEEAGSVGLEELVRREKDGFFARVDCVVISDNLWLSQRPALVYGTRGNSYFTVEVSALDAGGRRDAGLWESGKFSWACGPGPRGGCGGGGAREAPTL